MVSAQQEIHLWPTAPHSAIPRASGGATADTQAAIPLPRVLAVLTPGPAGSLLVAQRGANLRDDVVVEPFVTAHQQLRLLVRFPSDAHPFVNGHAAPLWSVLSPGDVFQWAPDLSFQVLLFNKPLIGPPPATVLGKPCPVCRTPFTANSITVTCPYCAVALHCDLDVNGLQCAQLRGNACPACNRPIVLTEGYVNSPTDDED